MTTERKYKIRCALEQGARTYRQIAGEVGCSISTVRCDLHASDDLMVMLIDNKRSHVKQRRRRLAPGTLNILRQFAHDMGLPSRAVDEWVQS